MTKKILIFTTAEGHLSIAQAVSESLKKGGFITQLSTVKGFKIYTPFYRYFPSFFKIPYDAGKSDTIVKTVKILAENWLEKGVKNEIKNFQPDLICSTYLFYNPAVAKVLDYQKTPLPFINIIANAWNIHPFELSSTADFNLVYDEKAAKISQKLSIPQEKILPLGWFTRKEFFKKYNLWQIREKLGFKKNVFTLLICGGSEGTTAILKIIPGLLIIRKPLQVIIVCGTNNTLYKTLFSFKKILPKIKKFPQLNLKISKFTNHMPQFMAISDLVIGKAGPNLIFETAAMQKPFFAVCHISGQEDNNLDLIRKKGLGFIEENPLKAVKLLKTIINKPSTLDRFKTTLKKEHDLNLQTPKKLEKLIRKMLKV
ncbi:MAG TPA: glycosyltransferase [Candidatus Bathyarchaeia archaeon]|nr:glycosyltransferase [Candidatus Bathyarchaeia archaeon]